jgi:hypothetical protein
VNQLPPETNWRPQRVVSGGQTGVDRAALEAAIENGIPHGGWCPRGRRAEDGAIPMKFQLTETASAAYQDRTEKNVLDSDATLILYRDELRGGTRLTQQLAEEHRKPHLTVDLAGSDREAALARCRAWLNAQKPGVLNIAGPRESQSPGIQEQTQAVLRALLGR